MYKKKIIDVYLVYLILSNFGIIEDSLTIRKNKPRIKQHILCLKFANFSHRICFVL